MAIYTINILFDSQDYATPLEAAKGMANQLKEYAFKFIYDVTDENTQESFTVDLSEEDKDAVLPN